MSEPGHARIGRRRQRRRRQRRGSGLSSRVYVMWCFFLFSCIQNNKQPTRADQTSRTNSAKKTMLYEPESSSVQSSSLHPPRRVPATGVRQAAPMQPPRPVTVIPPPGLVQVHRPFLSGQPPPQPHDRARRRHVGAGGRDRPGPPRAPRWGAGGRRGRHLGHPGAEAPPHLGRASPPGQGPGAKELGAHVDPHGARGLHGRGENRAAGGPRRPATGPV